MRNGDVIVWTKASRIMHPKLHVFSPEGKRKRTLKAPCQHDCVCIISQTLNNIEYLTVSCFDCGMIRLYNMDTSEVIISFSSTEFLPGPMCLGSHGRLYVLCKAISDSFLYLLVFDSSGTQFQLTCKICIPERKSLVVHMLGTHWFHLHRDGLYS